MKRLITAIYVTIIGCITLQCNSFFENGFGRPIYDHVIARGFMETGSENLVTAVYLFYRYYDTLFEAMMLLLSIIAVIYMSAHGSGDYHE